jgi:glycosyltransferase involved in cell wall biosynthesis
VEAFIVLERPLVYVLTWNGDYVTAFKDPRVIYDYVDDINVFYGNREEIAGYHKKLIQNAGLVLVTAQTLYNGIAPNRPDAVYCPNGVEYEHFAVSRGDLHPSPPPDLAPIVASGKPIIGYYGALARWFDYDLLKQVAGLKEACSFVLIGPDYDGTVRSSGIEACGNIHWLGVKTYQDLPLYLHYFDVAIIPFILSDITHAVSPLKLFEYMAGGKPIVATPMYECIQYTGVLFATGPAEFAQQIDTALSLGRDRDYRTCIDQLAQENTWDARALTILNKINSHPTPENTRAAN